MFFTSYWPSSSSSWGRNLKTEDILYIISVTSFQLDTAKTCKVVNWGFFICT